MLLANVCVHFPGKKSFHANTMSFSCHHVDFAVFSKTMHTEKYTIATCVKQKMATSDEDAAHISAVQFCFPSVLTPINTFCQLK